MTSRRTFEYFGGLFSASGGKAPQNAAGDLLNVLTGQRLMPRRGYQRLTDRPEGDVTVRGLMALSGTGSDEGTERELLAVRTFDGRTYPLAVPLPFVEAAAFTEVTNGGADVEMEEKPVSAFVYGKKAYVIQPGAAIPLWRHEVGANDSFTPIQNAAYVAPPDDPTFSATPQDTTTVGYDPTNDVIAWSDPSQTGTPTLVKTAESIELRVGSVNDNGNDGTVVLTVTYAAAKAVAAGQEYVSISVDAGDVMRVIRGGGSLLELDFGSGFVSVTGAWVTGGSSPTWALTGPMPQTGDLAAYRLTFRGNINEGATLLATVGRLQIGGSLLTATNGTQRPWLGDVPEKPIVYGARLKTATEAGSVVSEIKQLELNVEAVTGPTATNTSFGIGQRIRIHLESDDQDPHPYDVTTVEFLRKDVSGKWRILAAVTPQVGGGVSWTDYRRENELGTLDEATGDATALPDPPPPFSGSGIVGGLAYKEWAVYFREGGTKNVRHSKIGNAEELREGPDSAYVGDLTAPGDYSLEGRSDEPIGGVQAGQILVVFGKEAVYTQYGDSPSTMQPLRRIPESAPPSGARAFCRFRLGEGGYSAAWVDRHGNVYALTAAPRFSGDSSAEPLEISRTIRGYAREFLGADLSEAMLQYDERRDSLWCVLGRRALVLRPGDAIDGDRRWEAYEYAVTEDGYGNETWTPWSSVSTPSQFGGGANWTYGPPDAVEMVTPGASSQTLRREGYLVGLVTPGATVFEVVARVTEESEGPITRTAHVEATDPGPASVLATPSGVDDLMFAEGGQADYATIQAGVLAAEIEVERTDETYTYTAADFGVQDPLPEIEVLGASSAALTEGEFLINAIYSGSAPAPASVSYSLVGTTTAAPGAVVFPATPAFEGTASANFGNVTDTGAIAVPTPNPPPEARAAVNGTGGATLYRVGNSNLYEGNVPATATVSKASGDRGVRIFSFVESATFVGAGSEDVEATYSATVEMRARYGMGIDPMTGRFDALAFDRGDSWAVRSDSALVILESDPEGEDVGGASLDAGEPMPEFRWLSGWEDAGTVQRVANSTLVRLPLSEVTMLAETPTDVYEGIVAASRTYSRFPTSAQSVRWRFGATGTGATPPIESLSFDVVRLPQRMADRTHI